MANVPNLPRQDGAAAAAAPATVSPAIVGAGVGIGVLILVIIIAVVIRIQIVRRNHQRSMAELERGLASSPSRQMEMARPISAPRCGRLTPTRGQAGWDALYSNDSINEPEHAARPDKRQRTSVSTPPRMRQSKRSRAFRHLSAIMENTESSRTDSRITTPPSSQAIAKADTLMGSPKILIGQAQTADHAIEMDIADAYNQQGSPKLEVFPSFAINSSARYEASVANEENNYDGLTKTLRSVSAGVLDTDGAVFGTADRLVRNPKERECLSMHARCVSLGAPTSRPPTGPVPPLPTISPQPFTDDELLQMGVCVSREDSHSSMRCAGSSVLVTSPSRTMHDNQMAPAPPTEEQLVAEDHRAQLQSVLNRQCQSPYIFGPRQTAGHSNLRRVRRRAPVNGSTRRDNESALSHHLSMDSTSSTCSETDKRLSIPQIATAAHVSISRVSSSNSLVEGSAGRVQKIQTPPRRKSHRMSSVSASGSPAARDKRRSSALRDMSSNITGPVKRSSRRQMSISSQRSSCSSNGNPFQWDDTSNVLPKPSALKGSPNARKSKGRLSCVRISTLTPEVFSGRSRSSSLAAGIVMDEIVEERESEEIKRDIEQERTEVERAVAHEHRRSRLLTLPRNVSTDSCLRIQTLRASLTPSSPTLSSCNIDQEQTAMNTGGLASHPSGSHLEISPLPSRNSSRMSNRSSGNFSIPKFPSPCKARASVAVTIPQLDIAPMPQFSIDVDIESPTLGFNDFNGSAPFGVAVSPRAQCSPISPEDDTASGGSPVEYSPVSPIDVPSSPPLQISKGKEYDPGWCPVVVDFPSSHEYDPASPPFIWNGFSSDYPDPDRSSGVWLPFAVNANGEKVSPRTRMPNRTARRAERQKDDSPPQSPKTVPTAIPDLSGEKLTNSNASAMMSKNNVEPTSSSSFLGLDIPVLAPPAREQDTTLPQWHLQPRPATAPQSTHCRQRSISSTQSPRPSTARAPPLPTIPQSSSPASPPAPLAPKGPRSAPAKSVLKNAQALRRMNSEVQTDVRAHRDSRESRNFVRLGREPGPLLPWIGAETGDFESDTRGGAEGELQYSPAVSSSEDERGQQRQRQNKRPRSSVLGVPQVDVTPASASQNKRNTASALDELSFDALEKVIEGALAGFDAEHRASNTSPKYTSNRTSSVWDDGEKFWCARPESLELPQFKLGTPRRSGLLSRAMMNEESVGDGCGTVDPRLLMSTPTPGVGAGGVSVQATPRSLYDSDGFLRG